MGRTIIDMIKTTILEGNIDNELWPELVLVRTYIKNSHPTKALAKNISPQKAHFLEQPDLTYLQILESIIYVLLYKEKCLMKSEKWASQALKGTLVGFD